MGRPGKEARTLLHDMSLVSVAIRWNSVQGWSRVPAIWSCVCLATLCQCSIHRACYYFSAGGKVCSVLNFTKLHVLTLAAHSYVLLVLTMFMLYNYNVCVLKLGVCLAWKQHSTSPINNT